MIKLEFLKDIYYKGRVYKKGRKLSIDDRDAEAMIKRGRAKAEVEKAPIKRTRKKHSKAIKTYNK